MVLRQHRDWRLQHKAAHCVSGADETGYESRALGLGQGLGLGIEAGSEEGQRNRHRQEGISLEVGAQNMFEPVPGTNGMPLCVCVCTVFTRNG